MNSSGNIYASNDVNVGHQVNAQYVWASGNLNSNYIHSNGNIDADGRLNAGEFLYINGKANVGANCSPNGLQGTDSTGLLLSCVGGKWVKTSGTAGFFTKIKALAWLRILTLILVHVHLEQQLMNYFILHLLSNQVEEVMAVARQWLKIEYYTNVDDFFNTIKK